MKKNGNINWTPIIAVFLIIGALCVFLLVDPNAAAQITRVKDAVSNVFSPVYLWVGFGSLIFLIYICCSKYGSIKLGGGKPKYSLFSWMVMLFCAGTGTSVMLLSVTEWIDHYIAPPYGAEAFSNEAATIASTLGMYHYSVIGWAIYTVGAVALAYRFHVKKQSGLSLTAACEEAVGAKRVKGWLGQLIETIFSFGLVGGLSVTLVLGAPMISSSLAAAIGIEDSFALQAGTIIVIAAMFIITSYVGLDGGLRKLCDANGIIAIILAIVVLIVGPTLHIIKGFTNGLGYMLQNFVQMSLYSDPVGNPGWTENWTAFYWAWFLALGPWMWIFAVRVSKGRSIRAMILGMIGCGSLGAFLYYGVFSNYGLYLQTNGIADLVSVYTTGGTNALCVAFLSELPLSKLLLIIWGILAVMFLATTLDSATFTLAAAVTKGIKEDEEPKRWLRMFWSIALVVVPLGFLAIKADLNALKTMAVLTAAPISILTIISCISAVKYFRKDFGDKTRADIEEFNRNQKEHEDICEQEQALQNDEIPAEKVCTADNSPEQAI